MIRRAVPLGLLAVLAGGIGYLVTGHLLLLVVAAIGLVASVSGYVLSLGRPYP